MTGKATSVVEESSSDENDEDAEGIVIYSLKNVGTVSPKFKFINILVEK